MELNFSPIDQCMTSIAWIVGARKREAIPWNRGRAGSRLAAHKSKSTIWISSCWTWDRL